MANTVALTTTLRPTVAPNLPIGPVEYSQQFIDQYSNVLRLYFNQLDNFTGGLVSGSPESNGGRYLRFPHISTYDSANIFAASNTATIVTLGTISTNSGFTLNPNSSITCTYTGVYKIDYSLQFVNTDNAAHDADVWLRVNNQNVTESATRFTIQPRKSAGVPNYVCGYSHVTFQVNAGDVISLYWATNQAATANGSSTGVYIEALPAATTPYARPSIPSSIMSIQFVSGITT